MRSAPSTAWEDTDPPPPKTVWGICPLPLFSPQLENPDFCDVVVVPSPIDSTEVKRELHSVLNSVQSSADFGIYICESFKDPRRNYIDDYWADVADHAVGFDELHRLLGRPPVPLTPEANARFYQLARLFERLAARIDLVTFLPAPLPATLLP